MTAFSCSSSIKSQALSVLTVLAASASLLLPGAISAQQARYSDADKPQLVVIIAVDQLRPDYFERWGHRFTGGLGRLWTRGAVFTNAVHDHAITETAPGHATLGSGRFPRNTGILRNEVGVPDVQAPLIGGARGAGASPSGTVEPQ